MSAVSFRRFHPEPILMITDRPNSVWRRVKEAFNIDCRVIDTGFQDNCHRSSRVLKTQMFKLSPFDRTIFIDADTFVMKRLSALWRAPDGSHPVAMTLSQSQPRVRDIAKDKARMKKMTYLHDYELTVKVAGPDAPHYCSSTVAWRSNIALSELSEVWLREWNRFKSRDMMALARAISHVKVPVKRLDRKYSHRHILNDRTVIYTGRLHKMKKLHKEHAAMLKRVVKVLKG